MKSISFLAAAMVALSASPQPASGIITSVVETGGDNEATDTIVAQWTGQTFTVSIANEPIPGATIGQPYTVGTYGVNSPAFVDRINRYANDLTNNVPIPSYLLGSDYIMSGNDNRDNPAYRLDVTVNGAARAYMLIDNRLSDGNAATPPTFGPTSMQWILDQGWIATATANNRTASAGVPDEVGFDEGANDTIDQYFSVFYKDFGAGTFSLLQADNAGRNMYGVVVQPIPEPRTLALIGLGLAGILRRRRG
ncbi:MAG: PEP-CTERM sorting domain-containing protein [Verrucomicrobiales bacterium]